jgi:hypothetical protein
MQEVAARNASARAAAQAIKRELSARNPRKLKRGSNKSGKAGGSTASSPRSPTIGVTVFTAWPLVIAGVQYAAVVRTHSFAAAKVEAAGGPVLTVLHCTAVV